MTGPVDPSVIRARVRARLLAPRAQEELGQLSAPERRLRVRAEVTAVLREERAILPVSTVNEVVNQVSDEVVGLGPIERLLKDPEVSERLVNKRGQRTHRGEKKTRFEPTRRRREGMAMSNRFVPLATVVAAFVLLTGSSRAGVMVPTGACGSTFQVVPSPSPAGGDSELFGVTALSATDAWAVGRAPGSPEGSSAPLIEHWDGSAWSALRVSGAGSLSGLSAVGPDDVWAVGARVTTSFTPMTLIEHWDGSGWTVVPSPNAGTRKNGQLAAVAARSAGDAWAVGSYRAGSGVEKTLTLHWNGIAWSIVASPNVGANPNGLGAVAVIGPGDVWAAGTWFTDAAVDRTLAMHWNGTGWKVIDSPNVGSGENVLGGLAAVSHSDVWAVGFHGIKTLTQHWDGSSWSVVSAPSPGSYHNAALQGVSAVSASEVWAAGQYVADSGVVQTLVERWNGTSWTVKASGNAGTSDNFLSAVSALASGQWAVGSHIRNSGVGSKTLILQRCAA